MTRGPHILLMLPLLAGLGFSSVGWVWSGLVRTWRTSVAQRTADAIDGLRVGVVHAGFCHLPASTSRGAPGDAGGAGMGGPAPPVAHSAVRLLTWGDAPNAPRLHPVSGTCRLRLLTALDLHSVAARGVIVGRSAPERSRDTGWLPHRLRAANVDVEAPCHPDLRGGPLYGAELSA